jgi:prolyl-tRNA editing enzyme YbaK/EbsC (Cys-tRNA(Pro) deacylase)
MLGAEETLEVTGHPVGGVCPFGLATELPVYCDESLRAFATVFPAAGCRNSSVEIAPERLAEVTGASWVDACVLPEGAA